MVARTIGIIGFGVFGAFMTKVLSPHVPVVVSSRRAQPVEVAAVGGRLVSFDEACAADIVVPSVPVQSLEAVLQHMAPLLRPGSMVIDVSSVKTVPVQLMERHVPADVDIVATHPLFGPQSGADGVEGLPMVLWPVRVSNERFERLEVFLKGTLKLDVQQVSPDEHDREMAYVHALTFLLGRAFHDLDIPNTPLKTKTYQHLLDVRRIVENDTAELFETIQKYNPYAADMRQQLVVELQRLNDELAVER